jgi:ABC-type spermidine/putrescine transport system permease subunit I
MGAERRRPRGWLPLLAPALAVFGLLLAAPLLRLLLESARTFVSGHIGSSADAPLTLQNYLDLIEPAYAYFFLDTFRIGLIATAIALVAGYLLAFIIARNPSPSARKRWLAFMVGVLFLSVLVRVYALALLFSPAGILRQITALTGLGTNSPTLNETFVVAGMLNYLVPISVLTLIGTIQNVDPRLAEAAQALGAARWQAHLTITLPLSARGLLSAFLIDYTLCLSSFVVPLILGRGQVLFVSNLIFSRFAEVANYPSGAAISVVMLVVSMLVVYVMTRIAERRWKTG